jgi:lipoprotein-releasing system permease protein
MRYLSLFLYLKYLHRKKIVLLSIASVAMSCALLIIVASLFEGFIDAVENSSADLLGDIAIDSSKARHITDYEKLIEALEKSPQIEAATAALSSQAGLLHLGKGNVRAVQIWGIQLPERSNVIPFAENIISADTNSSPTFDVSDNGLPGALVGIAVMARPDETTDEYDIQAVKDNFIGKRAALSAGVKADQKPITLRLNIAGAIRTGIYEVDSAMIFLPIKTVSEKFYPNMPPMANMINIKIAAGADPQVALAITKGIWQDFAKNTMGWQDYFISQVNVFSARDKQQGMVGEYRKQMNILMLIFGIISMGVIVLIFCMFHMIVLTKLKDIAIAKSCGLGASGIAIMFIAFGKTIGLLGAALGVALGCLVIKYINPIEDFISSALGFNVWKSSTYMFDKVPNQIDWFSVAWISLAGILAATLGSLIPAITAAKTKPVKILRYE